MASQDSQKRNVSRRDFLRNTAKTAAGAAIGAGAARTAHAGVYKSIFPQTVLGANEKINIGFVGLGTMGFGNVRFSALTEQFNYVHFCDLNPDFLDRANSFLEGSEMPKAKEHTYFEEFIGSPDIDAVCVATPDHWHAIPTMMACDAGKDVYCEKPLGTTIAEGLAMVAKAKETGRIVQSGMIQRSTPHIQEAVTLIKEGYLGKVARADTWINDAETTETIGNPPDEEAPEWLDWERYLGWTPKVPYNQNRYIRNFRWFLDYSGGKMTDWGVHLMDIVMWALDKDEEWPSRVSAMGGKFILEDNRTTPDQLDVLYQFDDLIMSFSNRVCNDYAPYGGREDSPIQGRHGMIFFGDKGTLILSREGYEIIPVGRQPEGYAKTAKGSTVEGMYGPHWQNFADCIRDRKEPISSINRCHHTSTVCHMGTCSYVANGELHWDAGSNKFTGANEEVVQKANDFAYREYQNGWTLGKPYNKGWA